MDLAKQKRYIARVQDPLLGGGDGWTGRRDMCGLGGFDLIQVHQHITGWAWTPDLSQSPIPPSQNLYWIMIIMLIPMLLHTTIRHQIFQSLRSDKKLDFAGVWNEELVSPLRTRRPDRVGFIGPLIGTTRGTRGDETRT